MSSDAKQKICIECRSMVPLEAASCPECGYPFDDVETMRCSACQSIIVADVEACPVCGQQVEVAEEVKVVAETRPAQPIVPSEPENPPEVVPFVAPPPPPVEPEAPAAAEQAVIVQAAAADGNEQSQVMQRLDTLQYVLHELTSAIQANSRANDEIRRALYDNAAVVSGIAENHAVNQRMLQEVMDIVKAAYGTAGSGGSVADQLVEIKAAIADSGSQQAVSSNLLLTAVKENGAKAAVELPTSLKWLDYLFVVIVVILVFSIGNLLIMAYIARLLMQD